MVGTVLQGFFDYSVAFCQNRFKECGAVAPMFIGMNDALDFLLIPVTEMTSARQKDALVAEVKTLFREHKATACVFITEAWLVQARRPNERLRGVRGSLEHHPDRIEVISIVAETLTDHLHGHLQILRPEHGKPTLAPVVIHHGVEGEGRMFGLLK